MRKIVFLFLLKQRSVLYKFGTDPEMTVVPNVKLATLFDTMHNPVNKQKGIGRWVNRCVSLSF